MVNHHQDEHGQHAPQRIPLELLQWAGAAPGRQRQRAWGALKNRCGSLPEGALEKEDAQPGDVVDPAGCERPAVLVRRGKGSVLRGTAERLAMAAVKASAGRFTLASVRSHTLRPSKMGPIGCGSEERTGASG